MYYIHAYSYVVFITFSNVSLIFSYNFHHILFPVILYLGKLLEDCYVNNKEELKSKKISKTGAIHLHNMWNSIKTKECITVIT